MLMYSSRKMACPSTQMTNPLIQIQQCITDMVTHHQVEIKQVDQTHLTHNYSLDQILSCQNRCQTKESFKKGIRRRRGGGRGRG